MPCFVWITFFVSVASAMVRSAGRSDSSKSRAKQGGVVRVKAAYAGDEVDGKQQVMLRVGYGFFISKKGHVLVSASRGWS